MLPYVVQTVTAEQVLAPQINDIHEHSHVLVGGATIGEQAQLQLICFVNVITTIKHMYI